MKVVSLKLRICGCYLLLAIGCRAQVIDNTTIYTHLAGQTRVRFSYDNDFFTATDDYYTQGIALEFTHPGLQKNPLNKLLLHPRQSVFLYGVRADHYGYTPSTIRSETILYGDRPFCGNLSMAAFLIATDTIRHRRISSSLTVGIMGPAAGSDRMQQTIHYWLENIEPLGWEHQIRNDLILNYAIAYEQRLWKAGEWLLLNAGANLRVGTHTNRIRADLTLMTGRFDDPYRPFSSRKKWRFYGYVRLQPGFTLYDATLQGGIFNRQSPYTLSANELTRFTLQGDFGGVLGIGRLNLEYTQSWLSKEFKTGALHRWGGIRIGVTF